jgi:hypothetical protein
MTSSVSSNSFSRWATHDIFLFKYHFLLDILRFIFFFSDNIMADVTSKQQTRALFLSTIVTRTRRRTVLTKKTDKSHWKPVLCQRIFISDFRAFFTQLNCTVQPGVCGALYAQFRPAYLDYAVSVRRKIVRARWTSTSDGGSHLNRNWNERSSFLLNLEIILHTKLVSDCRECGGEWAL